MPYICYNVVHVHTYIFSAKTSLAYKSDVKTLDDLVYNFSFIDVTAQPIPLFPIKPDTKPLSVTPLLLLPVN